MTIRVGLVNPQAILLEEIAGGEPQHSVAATYALALETPDEVDWPLVNQAIIERWSPAGLRRVKETAWRMKRRA